MNHLWIFWYHSLNGGSAHRKASTYTGQHNTEKCGHTSMPLAGFEATIPVIERSKTIRALDRAATGVGTYILVLRNQQHIDF